MSMRIQMFTFDLLEFPNDLECIRFKKQTIKNEDPMEL